MAPSATLRAMIDVIDSGSGSAESHMLFDKQLLESLKERAYPLLHFYEWEEKSATYGHFLTPSDHLEMQALEREGIALAKRPTGGGITFHLWDLAFSVLIPATHEGYHSDVMKNYHYINVRVLEAIKAFLKERRSSLNLLQDKEHTELARHFCYAKPTRYDVMLENRKVAGAAQRKKRQGYLHQASISLCLPDFTLLEKLVKPQVVDAMREVTMPLAKQEELEEARALMKSHLQKTFHNL